MNEWRGTAGDELSQMLKSMEAMAQSKSKSPDRPKSPMDWADAEDLEEGKGYVMKSSVSEKKDEMPP